MNNPVSSARTLSLLIAVALGAGLPVLLPVVASEIPIYTLHTLFCVSSCLGFQLWWCRRRRVALKCVPMSIWHFVAAPIALFLLSYACNLARLESLIDDQLPEAWQQTDIELQFRLASLPEYQEGFKKGSVKASFYAEVIGVVTAPEVVGTAHYSEQITGRLVRLSWYDIPEETTLVPGQLWQAKARLRRPRGTVNPNGFDYQAWLLSRKVVASGYLKMRADVSLVTSQLPLSINLLRYRIKQRLFGVSHRNFDAHESLPSLANRGLLLALLLGDRSDISADSWRGLQNTGTIHLMAISGLHIGLVAGFCFALFRWLARLLAIWQPLGIRWLAPLMSSLFALIYALLSGFAVPSQRALILVVMLNLGYWLGRRLSYVRCLVVAVVAITLLDPFAFMQPGFWLSFSAVAILIYSFSCRITEPSRWHALLRAQMVLFVGMLVPLALLGLPVSFISPAANLIFVPLVSFAVIPPLLLAGVTGFVSVSLGHFFLQLADWVLTLAVGGLGLMSDFAIENPLLWHPRVSFLGGVLILAGLLGVMLLLAPKAAGYRVLGLLLLGVTLIPKSTEQPALKLTLLDVGQGLAVVIATPKRTLIYDTGARFGDSFDIGSRVIAPYLYQQGRTHIDTLVISHGDSDHNGGTSGLLATMSSERIISGEPDRVKRSLSALNTNAKASVAEASGNVNAGASEVEACGDNTDWQWDGVTFEVLWPIIGAIANPQTTVKSNNRSCVLLVSFGERRILIAGDIEAPVERILEHAPRLAGGVDVLVAPHHGSKTSSTSAFIALLKPRYVLFSAGYRNRYHHPHPTIVKRYQELGASLLRTDLDGALVFDFESDGGVSLSRERQQQRRLWLE